MGTISKRINPSGLTVYRVQIRVNKIGYPKFSQSKTFSRKSLAQAWMKKREAELEANPELLFGESKRNMLPPTLREASERYLRETQGTYATNKASVIRLLGESMLGDRRLDKLKRADFAEYAMMRARGIPQHHLAPVKPSTINADLQYLRSIIKHAHFVWGYEQVTWAELDLAMEGLRRSRVIGKAEERKRLPTSDELQRLTTYFYQQWMRHPGVIKLPMHLIMWFAIYSCRREGEIARMKWSDYREKWREWLVHDVKHPRGSKGNDKIFRVRDELLPVLDVIRAVDVQQRLKKKSKNLDCVFGEFDSRTISAAWRAAVKVLGIEDLHFHDLRHEGATRLAEDGLNIPHIQEVTLHTDWKMLQRYVNMGQRLREHRLNFAEAMAVAMQQK